MDASDWIAVAALTVSIATAGTTWWQRRSFERRADVTAYFHWLPSKAVVQLPSGKGVNVGYNLVLTNRGPRRAERVSLQVYRGGQGSGRRQVELADLERGELPLAVLDPGARYPVPWALGEQSLEFLDDRRFEVELTWRDGAGDQSRCIPLRRGNIGT